MITRTWADQKEIRQVMIFFQSHGVSSGYATKIFKQYENESIGVVKENLYRLVKMPCPQRGQGTLTTLKGRGFL